MVVALTTDLISFLSANADSEFDIGTVADALSASKRRLYDVANVLAGAGLIERRGKSQVKWIGRQSKPTNSRSERSREQKRKTTGAMMESIDQALANLMSSQRFQDYGYFSQEEIACLDPTKSVHLFALRGPSSMTIDLPGGEDGAHHMVCRTEKGRIEMIPIGAEQRSQENRT
jgi:hypothetical protein